MICILYICLLCTYIHRTSAEHECVNEERIPLSIQYLLLFTHFLCLLPYFFFTSSFPVFIHLSRGAPSSGPEPPTNIIFSELTQNSLTVSWTKPKSPISGFKVTYTQAEEGETHTSASL